MIGKQRRSLGDLYRDYNVWTHLLVIALGFAAFVEAVAAGEWRWLLVCVVAYLYTRYVD